MKHAHTPRILRASTAIFAVLALGSTPAWAQDAAAPAVEPPVISAPAPSVPAVAAPAAQTPTIQLPTQAPAPAAPAQSDATMASQPMVEQAPVTSSSAAEAATSERAARRTVERPAARTTSSVAPAASAPVRVPVTSAAPAQITPEPQVPPPGASVPIAQPEVAPLPANNASPAQASDSDMSLAAAGGVAALLLALGLGGGAYAAMRARRRRRWESEREVYETQPVQVVVPPAVAVHGPTSGLEPEASLSAFAAAEDIVGEPQVKVAEPTSLPTVAQRIGSEELVAPAKARSDGPVPQTRAERDALLEQMVSAPPSAENPFTSRKGRLRRARIILQSREIQQEQHATNPFDWRTYKPSTSNPAPATPPRVTA